MRHNDQADVSSDAESSGSESESQASFAGSERDAEEASASDGTEESQFDTVEADFEFFDPAESDFHGLKALLQSYLDGEAYSCSELVDIIIQQVHS